MAPDNDKTIDRLAEAFGPWDKDKTCVLPMIRPERVLSLVGKINEDKSGRATITKGRVLPKTRAISIHGLGTRSRRTTDEAWNLV
jgi:hypothetical protein